MYHRFPADRVSQDALRRQFAYIRRYYHPVSLNEVVQSWQTGKPLPRFALAITVDDGYADFETAWTLMRDFQLPATLFVVSDFLNRELWLWPDVVHFCVSRSTLPRIHLNLPLGGVFEADLADRQAADRKLDALLLTLPDESRREIIAMLPDATAVALPQEIPLEYAPLRWQELARMASEGLEVGAHTRTHPVLSRISSPERLQREVAGSRSEIETRLNTPVRHFCYPNGQKSDVTAASIAAVQQAGFLSASTAQRGLNSFAAGPWELRRIGVYPAMPFEEFALELSGFRMK